MQGGRQQDSHEFLRCLLGGIQQEHEHFSRAHIAQVGCLPKQNLCPSVCQQI